MTAHAIDFPGSRCICVRVNLYWCWLWNWTRFISPNIVTVCVPSSHTHDGWCFLYFESWEQEKNECWHKNSEQFIQPAHPIIFDSRQFKQRMVESFESMMCVFLGFRRARYAKQRRNDGMKGMFVCTSAAKQWDAHQMPTVVLLWCWIRAYIYMGIETTLAELGCCCYRRHPHRYCWLHLSLSRSLCGEVTNRLIFGTPQCEWCDYKTHMTWIRFRYAIQFIQLRHFVVCLHGLFSHFPNGVHISISRYDSNLSKIHLLK